MTGPLVRVEGLRVTVGDHPIVDAVDFTVAPGEVLALIGESGSGKTTIALTLLGYARSGADISGGIIEVAGHRLDQLGEPALRKLRGRVMAYVAQSAAAAFNPSLRIMQQVIEPALIHGTATRPEAEAKARALFRALALPDPDRVGDRYPHQVSGGQLQRLMAAMALITDPALVIFDEPTTALDVTTQIEVLQAFKAVIRERGTTAVYVSHDLAVVAQIADHIVVLRGGKIQEQGATEAILSIPAHPYSQQLVAAAAPRQAAAGLASTQAPGEPPLLEIRNVVAGYGGVDRNGDPRQTIVDDVSLSIRRGQFLGVIGESGCGKSTLARVIAGLHPAARGSLALDGSVLPRAIAERSREQLRRIQIVFQSADTALNPATTIAAAIGRPLTFFHGLKGAALDTEIARLLDIVRLPAGIASRRPGELSGGQKQRINLGRALAARPDVILCDEVTSALDPVVAEAVLDLLLELRRELGLAVMFISHDIETVRAISDELMVLYSGQKVDHGTRASLLQPPHHPYARLLAASVPNLRVGWLDETCSGSRGAVRNAGGTAGCRFYPRCDLAVPGLCDTTPPPRRVHGGREIACHRSIEDLVAAGD